MNCPLCGEALMCPTGCGVLVVKKVETPIGPVQVVVNPMIPADEVRIIGTRDYVRITGLGEESK